MLHVFNEIYFLQRKIYKDQAEMMLVNHVYPEFSNENGFLRARVRRSHKKSRSEINLMKTEDVISQHYCL